MFESLLLHTETLGHAVGSSIIQISAEIHRRFAKIFNEKCQMEIKNFKIATH